MWVNIFLENVLKAEINGEVEISEDSVIIYCKDKSKAFKIVSKIPDASYSGEYMYIPFEYITYLHNSTNDEETFNLKIND